MCVYVLLRVYGSIYMSLNAQDTIQKHLHQTITEVTNGKKSELEARMKRKDSRLGGVLL